MKALRLVGGGAPLELAELPDPTPGPEEVVVQVAAAGICHSDAHYRAGEPRLPPLPRTLGHEVAGRVAAVGAGVAGFDEGDRVGVHYQLSCGSCDMCGSGREQFCAQGAMIGNHVDGGYAEYVGVPARNLVLLPDEVSFDHGAVMMCSSATSLHALHRARLEPGERVAVFGLGGLGASAVQLARALGAGTVVGVDTNPDKVEMIERWGFHGIDASRDDPVERIMAAGGVDVALELVGLASTTAQALRSLRPGGRAAVVGLTAEATLVRTYDDVMGREAELIGVMDHLYSELIELMVIASSGSLDLSEVVTGAVTLDPGEVNAVLDELEAFGGPVRTVIHP